jgi:hypothetical protein
LHLLARSWLVQLLLLARLLWLLLLRAHPKHAAWVCL